MVFTKAQAKSLAILDVARSLGMEMKRNSHKTYRWAEHDSFVIDTVKNNWRWYSQTDKYGDTIGLVQEIRNVSYKEAMTFLETGNFPEAKPREETQQPFRYTLAPYEQPFREARTYLKEIRGLSDDTIDFFLQKGVLAQAKRKDRDGFTEDVLVFKYLDKNQNIVGASLQGLIPYPDRHPAKGYLKQTMYQSEGIAGLNVSIGSPNRLIVAEAPIDLMSYYELHKDELEDVRLVAMEGLKEGLLSRYALEVFQEKGIIPHEPVDYTRFEDLTRTSTFLANAAKVTTLFHDHKYDNLITLAVDNDKAGTDFIETLREKNIPVIDARPLKENGQEKMDWNEYLQIQKELATLPPRGETKEHLAEQYQVRFHWSEASVFDHLKEGMVISYTEFATILYQENQKHLEKIRNRPTHSLLEESYEFYPYTKTKFDLISADGEVLEEGLRYNIGDEMKSIGEILEGVSKSYSQDLQLIDSMILESEKIELFQKEKANDLSQSQEKKAEGTIGDFPDFQEAAPLPEANQSQPLNDLSPSQTQPQPLLYFTTKEGGKSIDKRYYHVASPKEVTKLNRYAPIIQQTATWYLETMADSRIIYIYQDQDSISSLAVQFDRDKFMHLTGVFPYREGQTAEQTLLDFASGKGDFDSILMANKGATFDKLKVLPELEAIIESDAFYFGDLSQVPKLHQLELDKAVKSGDEDVLLALRTVDGTPFPASLLKLRKPLNIQLKQTNEERIILGVYRYRNNQLEQLSINEEYVKDGGDSFKTILNQVVEDLNQSTSSSTTVGKEGVYYDAPDISRHIEKEQTDKKGSQSTMLENDRKKLDKLLASKDRAGLSKHLKDGIHQYLDSKQYKEFLATMSRFPHYSYRNVMLLKAQKTDVSAVTSFKSWKETFSRTVKKGEKALRIFAPMTVKVKNPETGEIVKDAKGNALTRTIFKLVPVFDVSQTEGKELPKPIYQLEGTHENYSKLYRSAKEYATAKGLRFEFDTNLQEANGYYSYKDQKIVIKSGMSEQQTLKTIFHEIAHADLHSSKSVRKELKYSHAELQAESVAYIVANHYGLDTADYSFGYLASWIEDKEALTDLEAQLEIVQKEAQQLIDSLDAELEKQLNQSLDQSQIKQEPAEKLSFEERLSRAEKLSQGLEEKQEREEEKSKKQIDKESQQER